MTPLDLWQRGLSVIPVPRPDDRHDGKKPAIAWGEFQERRATEAEILRWFVEPQNVAIVTGAISGVVVVDLDSPEAMRWGPRNLPYTPWQTKTARGYHLFYKHPGVCVKNRARIETRDGKLAIDVRGDGGFVIAAGSRHASGVDYLAAGDWNVSREELPTFSPDWLAAPKAATVLRPAAFRPTGNVVDRARKYLDAIPRPEIGNGSDGAVFVAACRLVRDLALGDGDATALLWEWAGNRPGWTRDWIAEKVTHAARHGSGPIGAMR